MIGILSFLAFSSITFRFAGLYPGSMTRNFTSKSNLLWIFNSWKSFAISMESFPPEIQTAMRSPGLTSSYWFIAFVNLHQMLLRNFLRMESSTSLQMSTSSSCFIASRSHAIYPPSRLTASIPFSSSPSATSTLKRPRLQQITNFFEKSMFSFPSMESAGVATAPGIAPWATSFSSRISMIW